jgi:uncharacterized protein YecA (UPF0149 family)
MNCNVRRVIPTESQLLTRNQLQLSITFLSTLVGSQRSFTILGSSIDSCTRRTSSHIDSIMADTKEDMSKSQAKFADPFATREGKTLTWQNVNMTLVRSFCDKDS